MPRSFRQVLSRLPSPVRAFWLTVGALALALALVGVFLPLLPTTPFVILAVFAFAKSAPSLAHRIEASRTFGPAVRSWREEGAIRPRYKILAMGMMIATLVLSVAMSVSTTVLIIQVVCMGAAATFILTRPNGSGHRPSDNEERPEKQSGREQ